MRCCSSRRPSSVGAECGVGARRSRHQRMAPGLVAPQEPEADNASDCVADSKPSPAGAPSPTESAPPATSDVPLVPVIGVLSSALEATLTRDALAGGVTDADAVVVLLVHEDRGRVLRVIERLGGAPIAIDELRAALETAPHESRRVTPTRPSSRPILERQRAEPLERQRAEPGDASPSPRATGPVARHRSRGHRTFEPSTRSGPSSRWGGDRPRSRHRSCLVS